MKSLSITEQSENAQQKKLRIIQEQNVEINLKKVSNHSIKQISNV